MISSLLIYMAKMEEVSLWVEARPKQTVQNGLSDLVEHAGRVQAVHGEFARREKARSVGGNPDLGFLYALFEQREMRLWVILLGHKTAKHTPAPAAYWQEFLGSSASWPPWAKIHTSWASTAKDGG